MYFIYSVLMGLAGVLLAPYWSVQGLRKGKYLANLRERLWLSAPILRNSSGDGGKAMWIHAVSVGEVLSSVTLARRLKQKYPGRPLVVSTTTITGQAIARERMAFADAIVYFPLDWAFCVRRALRAVDPEIVLIVETEIWPNFLRECARCRIPVILVSGRISDRSYRRYKRYFALFGFFLKPFLRNTLSHFGALSMQTEQDAERIKALGAPPDRVRVGGNLKYDLEIPGDTPIAAWLEEEAQKAGRRPIIVAGSVVATEEPLALIAFGVLQGEYPKALLVLAPRKPERFEAAAEFIKESHRNFVRRSELPVPKPGAQAAWNGEARIPEGVSVLLLDSIGELASLYRLADGVFVGGSLVPSGGHNILEPAAFGKIPVFGESMENFAEMSRRFLEAGAAVQVSSPEDAGVTWIELLRNPERARAMGDAARRLVEENRGATSRAVESADGLLGSRAAAKG